MRTLYFTNDYSKSFLDEFVGKLNKDSLTMNVNLDDDNAVTDATMNFLREMMPNLFFEVGSYKDGTFKMNQKIGNPEKEVLIDFIDKAYNEEDSSEFMFDDGEILDRKALDKFLKQVKDVEIEKAFMSDDELFPDQSFDAETAYLHNYWYLSKKSALNEYNSFIDMLFEEKAKHPDQFVDLAKKQEQNRFANYFVIVIKDFLELVGEKDLSRGFEFNLPIVFESDRFRWHGKDTPMMISIFVDNHVGDESDWFIVNSMTQAMNHYQYNVDKMAVSSNAMLALFREAFFNFKSKKQAINSGKYQRYGAKLSEFFSGSETCYLEYATYQMLQNAGENIGGQ